MFSDIDCEESLLFQMALKRKKEYLMGLNKDEATPPPRKTVGFYVVEIYFLYRMFSIQE